MLLDTSRLLCFHHAAEPQHEEAVTFMDAAPIRITHNYVLAEFIALAGVRRLPRREALAFVADLQGNPLVEVVYVDEALHREALSFLQQRLDKTWTLCDAVSFLLMQKRGIVEALSTDPHFEQAGFIRLLRP
ncbi:MAG: type II toxin-antitoxin system VapC family toxin [bacterium]